MNGSVPTHQLNSVHRTYSMNDDMETTDLCKAELVLTDAGLMYLFPDSRTSSIQIIATRKKLATTDWVLPAFLALSTAA